MALTDSLALTCGSVSLGLRENGVKCSDISCPLGTKGNEELLHRERSVSVLNSYRIVCPFL